mgnify:CR=1 FL=1
MRDLIVYTVTSIRYLLLKGKFRLFTSDIFSFAAWRRYRTSSKGTLDYRIPWLVFSSISFLNKWLKKEMRVFEYGSGGSTLYFASRVERVISIEHSCEWYSYAKNAILSSGFTNIEYALVEPQLLQNASAMDCSNPVHYVSCFTEYKGYEFSSYAKAIDLYPDASFDLVVVDGRVRHSCIAHSMQKVKQHGMLLLDNADRAYYLAPFPELQDRDKWKEISFAGHFPFGPASVLNTTKLFIKR